MGSRRIRKGGRGGFNPLLNWELLAPDFIQVGFCKRYKWIRDGGKPIPLEQAVETAKPLAVLAAISGVAVIAFAIAIPIAQIRFGTWQSYLLVIASLASLAGVVRHISIGKYRRRRVLTDYFSESHAVTTEHKS